MANFRILGSVEAWNGAERLRLRGPVQLRLFAFLVLHPNRALSADELNDAIWPSGRLAAGNRLPMAIRRLRETLAPLGEGVLRTVAGGYLMTVGPGDLDADVFEAHVREGQQALADRDPARTLELITTGLDLWRGPALAEVRFDDFALGDIHRLEERQWDAREARVDAQFMLGRDGGVIGELEGWLAEEPTREVIAARLMLALYRGGHQARALEVYQRTRMHLNQELGIEPGLALQDLQARILNQDPSLLEGAIEPRVDDVVVRPRSDQPGRSEAAQTTEPGKPVSAPLPTRLAPYGPELFVDRQAERNELLALLAEASAPAVRRAAFVSGEAGIGKTRLVSEIARQAHQSGTLVLAGRCDNALDLPYQPFVEAIEHLVEHAPLDLLEAHVAENGDSIARLVPALALRTSQPPPVASHSSESERYVLFRAIERLLAAACAHGSVLLVLEDLHWAEIATVSLLRRLLTSSTRPPLTLLGTCRVNGLPNDHPLRELLGDLHRDQRALRLELSGLNTSDTATLVIGLSDDAANSADDLLTRSLQANTNGNPFFITELVRGLVDSGALRNNNGHLQLETDADVTEHLPLSITETLARRIARIGADVERCLQVGAVCGAEFDIGLISEIADVAQIAEMLDDAVKAGILVDVAGEPGRFRFAHALLQRYLYGELGPARRAALHGQIALALEGRLDSGRSHAADVARHWLAAGETGYEGALQYAARAGDEALGKLAPEEARRWYELALELIAREHDERQGQRCDLLIGRGEAERQTGDLRFRETLLEAARLAQELGDGPRLVRAALSNTRGMQSETGIVDDNRLVMLDAALAVVGDGDTKTRARLLAIYAAELMYSDDRDRRTALTDEALALARELQDPEALSTVLNMRFVTLLAPDTFDERRASSAEAVEVSERVDDPLARFYAYHWRAYVAIEAGDISDARAWLAREREIANRFRQPTTVWLARADEANLAIITGELESAGELASDALKTGQQSEPDALACYAAQQACIAFELGQAGDLIPQFEQAVAANPGVPAFRATFALALTQGSRLAEARAVLDQASRSRFEELPFDVTWLAAMCIYASVSVELADTSAATLLYERLEPWHEQVVFPAFGVWGPVDLYLGALAGLLGKLDAARSHVGEAARMARHAGAPIWAARAASLLALMEEAE
jgi:DNA-binding SARP family transcriptional activator